MSLPPSIRATVRWLADATLLSLAPIRAALPAAATEIIARAGNADDDAERRDALVALAALPGLAPKVRRDAEKLAAFARQWTERALQFYNA